MIQFRLRRFPHFTHIYGKEKILTSHGMVEVDLHFIQTYFFNDSAMYTTLHILHGDHLSKLQVVVIHFSINLKVFYRYINQGFIFVFAVGVFTMNLKGNFITGLFSFQFGFKSGNHHANPEYKF